MKDVKNIILKFLCPRRGKGREMEETQPKNEPTAFNLKAIAAWVAPQLDAKRDVTCDMAHAMRLLKNVRMLYLELRSEEKESVKDKLIVEIAAILWPLFCSYVEKKIKDEFLLLLHRWIPLFPEEKTRIGALTYLLQKAGIEEHEKEPKHNDVPQELMLLRDAIKIGALGAIGNYLAFARAAKQGKPAVLPTTPSVKEWMEKGSPRLENDGSLVGEFFAQTLHLPFMMYHHKAKDITTQLIGPMLKFANALVEEFRNTQQLFQ